VQRAIVQAVGQARALVDRERAQREENVQRLEVMIAGVAQSCDRSQASGHPLANFSSRCCEADEESSTRADESQECIALVERMEKGLQTLVMQLRNDLGDQRQRVAMLEEHFEFQKALWDERHQQLSASFVTEIGRSYREMSSQLADREAGLQKNFDSLKDQVQQGCLHLHRGVRESLESSDDAALPSEAVVVTAPKAPSYSPQAAVPRFAPAAEEWVADPDSSTITTQMRALQGTVSGLSAELATTSTRLAVDILGARAESSKAFYLANDAFQTARRLLQVIVGDDMASWRTWSGSDGTSHTTAAAGPPNADRDAPASQESAREDTLSRAASSPALPAAPPPSLRRMHSGQSTHSNSALSASAM